MSNITEPATLRAGDPWSWRRVDLVDAFPASLYDLSYRFGNEARSFDVAASADGDEFVVNLNSDQTAAYVAGSYTWQARVTLISDNTQRHIVTSGATRVLANMFAGTVGDPVDGRSAARQGLDAINAMLLGRATSGQQEYTIGNRQLRFIPIEELIALRNLYAMDVARELAAESIANGNGDPSNHYVRFRRV